MIVSEIFEIPITENLTKSVIEKFFLEKNIKPVKWAVTKVLKNSVQILASFEKN